MFWQSNYGQQGQFPQTQEQQSMPNQQQQQTSGEPRYDYHHQQHQEQSRGQQVQSYGVHGGSHPQQQQQEQFQYQSYEYGNMHDEQNHLPLLECQPQDPLHMGPQMVATYPTNNAYGVPAVPFPANRAAGNPSQHMANFQHCRSSFGRMPIPAIQHAATASYADISQPTCHGVGAGQPTILVYGPTAGTNSLTNNFQQTSSFTGIPTSEYAPKKPAGVKRGYAKVQQPTQLTTQPSGSNPTNICEICGQQSDNLHPRKYFGGKMGCLSCAGEPLRVIKDLLKTSFRKECGGDCDTAKVRELLLDINKTKGDIFKCCRYKYYGEMGLIPKEMKLESKGVSPWITVIGFHCKSSDILKHFQQYGEIIYQKLDKDADNCLYICYSAASDMLNAFASDGIVFGQNKDKIVVQYCSKPPMEWREEEENSSAADQRQNSSRTAENEGQASSNDEVEKEAAQLARRMMQMMNMCPPDKCMELFIPTETSLERETCWKIIHNGAGMVQLLRATIGFTSERELKWFIQMIICTSQDGSHSPVSRLRFTATAGPTLSTTEYLLGTVKDLNLHHKDICDGDFDDAHLEWNRWTFLRAYHCNDQLTIKREICDTAILPLMDSLFRLPNILKGGRHFTCKGKKESITLFTEDVADKIVLGEDVSLSAKLTPPSITEFVTRFGAFGCQNLEICSKHCTKLDPLGWLPDRVCHILRDTPLPEECVGILVMEYSPQLPFKWPTATMKQSNSNTCVEENKIVYELENIETKILFEITIICPEPLEDHYNKSGIHFTCKRM